MDDECQDLCLLRNSQCVPGVKVRSGLRVGDKHDPMYNQKPEGGEGCALPELKVAKGVFPLVLLTATL